MREKLRDMEDGSEPISTPQKSGERTKKRGGGVKCF